MTEVATNPSSGDPAADISSGSSQFRMSKWGMLKAFVIRMVVVYFVFNFFKKPQQNPGTEASSNQPVRTYSPSMNILDTGDLVDLFAYISHNDNFENFNSPKHLVWQKENLRYGDWNSGENNDGSYSTEWNFKTDDYIRPNGSLYLHVYLVRSGYTPDPSTNAGGKKYSKKFTIHKHISLTRHKKRRLHKTVNLLTGESTIPINLQHNSSLHPTDMKFLPPATHWHPNLTINLVHDHTPWTRGSIPSTIVDHLEFNEATNQYYPIVYLNNFWNLNEEYMPVNETTPELKLSLTFAPMSLFKWQMYVAQGMKNNWYTQIVAMANNQTSSDEDLMSFEEEIEQDTLKKTLIGTNPYLLGLTVVVSMVHAVFEMLAFKNDIQFWRSRESIEGLSARSVLFNVFQSLIVVLYVLDNQTNFVIKCSVCVGLLIEAWKIFKVVNVRVNWEERNFLNLPKVEWNFVNSYVESETKIYDQMAYRYLSWLLFPLLGGYCVYSLVYQEHRGWYSWVLSMLYGFLLTFGFITMTPQLFINYKMKSVAHLPWRMLTYKALNTFIDDLFAFIIQAPTLYRIGCLRDDVIFFIYLYQRWIYSTDPKRINEFGVSQEMLDENEKKKKMMTLTTTDSDKEIIENGEAANNEDEDQEEEVTVRKRKD